MHIYICSTTSEDRRVPIFLFMYQDDMHIIDMYMIWKLYYATRLTLCPTECIHTYVCIQC